MLLIDITAVMKVLVMVLVMMVVAMLMLVMVVLVGAAFLTLVVILDRNFILIKKTSFKIQLSCIYCKEGEDLIAH